MSNPVLLSRSIVNQTLSSDAFFAALPEFSTLRAKLKTMQIKPGNQGCSGCGGRRVEQNLFGDFLLVLRSLDKDALQRFKQFIKAESVMYSVQDPKTGAFETRII